MPKPILQPCGGEGQDPCPPQPAVMQALSDLVWANEVADPCAESNAMSDALAAAHEMIDPFIAPQPAADAPEEG